MDNKYDKSIILNALEFYGIDDISYKEKCLECIDYINSNEELKNRIDSIYNIIYIDKENRIRALWKYKTKEDLFGSIYHSFVTNVLLLFGYQFHIENINKYNLDEKQIKIHKKRVRDALTIDIYEKGFDGISLTQMLWGIYFINMRLIEVGRLQYEFIDFNPFTDSNENCIKIHIPRGSKLEIDEVISSIKNSRQEIKKYFGLDNTKYFCSSWLLSRQIIDVLDSSSNIYKFYNLFNVYEKESCINDVLRFLFNVLECKDYNNLKEETSLQRNIKKILLEGIDIKIGLGVLKEEILL